MGYGAIGRAGHHTAVRPVLLQKGSINCCLLRLYVLQEKAAKWRTFDGQMDGLTTNGVLVMHPRNGFSQDSKPGVWREISVCGNVFTLRETRSAQQRGKMVRKVAFAFAKLSRASKCAASSAGWLFADCPLLRGRLIMKPEYPEKLQRSKVKSHVMSRR